MERKVWVGLEGSYASGKLVGRWLDAAECTPEGMEDLLLTLQAEDLFGGEELSIMDHEGWGQVDPRAFPMGHLSEIDDLLSERPEAAALIGAHGTHYYRDADAIREGLDNVSIYGPYQNGVEDYAWAMVDDGAIEVPESVRNYVDFEALGRDLAMDGTEVQTDDGLYLIFG